MADLSCTYRLQLLPHLDFRRRRELVPYLEQLGVSHLYLVAVDAGPTRLDARLRRRRSDAALGGAGRRGRVSRELCDGRASE